MQARKIVMFALGTSLLLASCSKMDQVSPNYVDSENVFTNTSSLEDGLRGLYSSMGSVNYYGSYYPMLADLNADISTAGGYADNQTLSSFGAHDVPATNAWLGSIWVAMYNSIGTANKIITAVDAINAKDGTNSTTNNQIKGKALAIRALIHFDLLRMFGYHWDVTSKYGIPVVLTTQKATDVVARSTVANTYSAIISDLTQAESLLDNADVENANYVSKWTVKALLARVYLYKKDMTNAAAYATQVIGSGLYGVLDASSFTSIYTQRLSSESIFELGFTTQMPSYYNAQTYFSDDVQSTQLYFLAAAGMKTFFTARTGDLRIDLFDFTNTLNDSGDGRTQKYRGETTKDNPAYILRISEMYLIRAEANSDVSDLNMIRTNRGLTALGAYTLQDLQDERKAEFNFEGHRYFDLARWGEVATVLGTGVKPVMPIPYKEVNVTAGVVEQNPGY